LLGDHIKDGIFKSIGVEKPQVKRSSNKVPLKRSDRMASLDSGAIER